MRVKSHEDLIDYLDDVTPGLATLRESFLLDVGALLRPSSPYSLNSPEPHEGESQCLTS